MEALHHAQIGQNLEELERRGRQTLDEMKMRALLVTRGRDGMALFEHTTYDPQSGAPINSNLADYMMTVNADAPPIDVHFLDYPDKEINELGARGIGEIGLAGVAAAITEAVHHATGVRVRELPIKIEDLLTPA